jgi:hypothetical protein
VCACLTCWGLCAAKIILGLMVIQDVSAVVGIALMPAFDPNAVGLSLARLPACPLSLSNPSLSCFPRFPPATRPLSFLLRLACVDGGCVQAFTLQAREEQGGGGGPRGRVEEGEAARSQD